MQRKPKHDSPNVNLQNIARHIRTEYKPILRKKSTSTLREINR